MPMIPAFPEDVCLTPIESFLESETGRRWIVELADSCPHSRYWRDRDDCWSLKQLNGLAALIIDARYAGDDPEEVMEAAFPPAELGDTWRAMIAPGLRDQLEAAQIADLDHEIRDAIRAAWEEEAAARDESNVADLFASHDHCELLFRFSTERWLDDSLIHSRRPWAEAAELQVTRNLQFALTNLGYTVSQFRKASGNRHPASEFLQRSARRRRAPIIAWDQVNELIENACSTSFLFALYVIVPIRDLLALDLGKPVTFDKYWVASMDPINGTFHDVPGNGSVKMAPTDGKFLGGGHLRWSPDAICGLHTPHYYATVAN